MHLQVNKVDKNLSASPGGKLVKAVLSQKIDLKKPIFNQFS